MQKWDTHEIVLNAAQPYDNPYLEVNITAVFEGPTGEHLTAMGFWDDGRTYRVRLTPTAAGRWHYTIDNNQGDPGLRARGTIDVAPAPPDAHGFVRRDVAYPTSFIFDDGTRYFMWGTTYYGIANNARAGDRWIDAIDGARRYGINKVRMHIYPFDDMRSERNPYPDTQPFLGTSEQPDHDRLNVAHWQALDRVVQYIGDQGMVADLIVFQNNARVFGSDAQSERFARYVIARYAAYPHVIWCMCNEWNYSPKPRPFWNRIGQLFRDEDPWMENGGYLRAHSIHQQTRLDFQFFHVDWPVHAIVQYGVRNGQRTIDDEWDESIPHQARTRHGDAWGNLSIVYNLDHGMPVVNDEYGYIGEPADKSEPGSPPFTREKHRQVMWGIAAAGGYGSTGDKTLYNDGSPYRCANWHDEPLEYDDVRHLIAFFAYQGLEYWKMSSRNDLVRTGERVYVLAEEARQYVIYAAVGGSIAVDLAPGTYQVRQYDPCTGQYTVLGTTSGGVQSFDTPNGSDGVILCTSATDSHP